MNLRSIVWDNKRIFVKKVKHVLLLMHLRFIEYFHSIAFISFFEIRGNEKATDIVCACLAF